LIIGAGPYGLSLAAHLRAEGVEFRIVGSPMAPWRTSMPAGMFLKSEGFASSLYDPAESLTLGAYCAERGIPYADIGVPVPVETFIAYGETFQQRLVPQLEDRTVVHLEQTPGGFEATCADGGTIRAGWVVLGSGILDYAHIPPGLRALPSSVVSHSSDHHGAGASAMDIAASLRACGARVTVVARRSKVAFQTPLGDRSLLEKLRAPMTPVGPGWKSVLCTKAPMLFHHMPDGFRTDVVRRYLGPAPGWFSREPIEGHVPIVAATTIREARVVEGRVQLALQSADRGTSSLSADHIVAATGFKVDVGRIGYLDRTLSTAIASVDGAPRLSRHFESSVRGLYFTGPAAANSFGPMLRFAAGARFAAQRLSRHLAGSTARVPAARVMTARPEPAAADG
jgi:hypothetical protein